MLILAGVTIATLTGENGILTRASDARRETEIAEVKEMIQTDIIGVQTENEGKITGKQFDEILVKYGTVSGEEENRILTTKNGYEIKVKDIWNGTTAPNPILAGDVLKVDNSATDAKDKSPYVRYNGIDCRVLYNDETHGIQIITAENQENVTLGYGDENVTEPDFTYEGTATVDNNFLKAATSYNNAVDNLKNRAKTYMDTKGIAKDARCLGSNPTLTSGYKFQSDTSEMWSGAYDYLTTYSWNGKFKIAYANYLVDVNQLNKLELNVSSGGTWLASRNVASNLTSSNFGIKGMNSTGSVGGANLCDIYSAGNSRSYSPSNGLRPIFLLTSDVIINEGDGSAENPYIIE